MKTVFVDVDTQLDFMSPSGALYVPGAENILDKIAALNRLAGERAIFLISTMDAHSENDPEFVKWPPHCVAGTLGQRKPAATLLDRRAIISSKPGEYKVDEAQQLLLEKQHLDCFTNPNLAGILETIGADRYVVYGVVTEYCVNYAASGLLATGKRVEIVTDAVKGLDGAEAERTMRGFAAAGGFLIDTAAV